MAEKTDEEIIKEVGLETSNISEDDALEALSIDDTKEEELLSPVNEDLLEEELTTNNKNSNKKDNVLENEDRDDETSDSKDDSKEELPIQKKKPKIYKILVAIVVFLVLILAIGLILYLTGFFEPKAEEKPIVKKVEKKVDNEIEFDTKDLNRNKLNKKLTSLTKHEIMNKEELEAEEKRIQEEERLKKEAEQKAIEEKKRKEEEKLKADLDKIAEEKRLLEEHRMAIKKEQEEFIKLQEKAREELEMKKEEFLSQLNNENVITNNIEEKKDEITEIPKKEVMNEQETSMEEKESSKTFLSFINVATIKGELYKSYLDKVLTIDKNVSLCRDSKNRIEIYFGPYDSNKERDKVLNTLLENDFKESYLVDFTKEEYQKRCKY